MKRNYFIVDDKKHYTGTVFLIKLHNYPEEASFICCDEETNAYFFQIGICKWQMSEQQFRQCFISITNKVDSAVSMPVVKKMKDSQVDGLFEGWVLYIVAMVTTAIFNERIGLWILWSYLFFSWRNNKIKKEGTYVEW